MNVAESDVHYLIYWRTMVVWYTIDCTISLYLRVSYPFIVLEFRHPYLVDTIPQANEWRPGDPAVRILKPVLSTSMEAGELLLPALWIQRVSGCFVVFFAGNDLVHPTPSHFAFLLLFLCCRLEIPSAWMATEPISWPVGLNLVGPAGLQFSHFWTQWSFTGHRQEDIIGYDMIWRFPEIGVPPVIIHL